MDIRVSQRPDAGIFRAVASDLQSKLGGIWSAQLDGPDHRYWDLLVGPDTLTLHLEQYTGIFLDTQAERPATLLERAAAAVPDQEDWTIRLTFSGLFCPGSGDEEETPLAAHLTEDNNHIHGALEVCVGGRVLPRLGFFGPHDVCLNTWLVELRRAIRLLDEAGDVTFVFDECEQGQPLFRFRRNSTSLFLSVDDSVCSGAQGEASWKDVACDYDDFRFQVFRFSGALRNLLQREVGAAKANAWFQDIEAA